LASSLALTLPAVASSGCALDERMIAVKPDPIVLGTFEAGTAADDPRFGSWSAYPNGSDLVTMMSSLVHDGCAQSAWCLGLDWQVTDPPDGRTSEAGVVDRVAPLTPIDLSGYARLVFDHQSLHQGPCGVVQTLTLVLACEGLSTAFQTQVSLSSSWTTRSIELASFVEADAPPPKGVARQDCLGAVSAILFQTSVALSDGECASGNLLLDNVSVRGAP
jgi:hypothetical protein